LSGFLKIRFQPGTFDGFFMLLACGGSREIEFVVGDLGRTEDKNEIANEVYGLSCHYVNSPQKEHFLYV
jgi:hypothetical protein